MGRRRTILVDGYNLIGATRGLRAHDLERAREALLDRMSAYARARGHEVVVVFDGADLPVDYYPRKGRAGVRAVFTAPGEKADPVLVAEAQRRQGRCVVVTDDREVRRACDEAGAVVLGCEEFEGYVRRARPADHEEPEAPGGKGVIASPAPTVSEDDLEAWERFVAGVTPLPGGAGATTRPGVPEVPVQASRSQEDDSDRSGPPAHPLPADLLAALLDVPDEVARQRGAEDAARFPEAPRGPRDARRRKNVLDDL